MLQGNSSRFRDIKCYFVALISRLEKIQICLFGCVFFIYYLLTESEVIIGNYYTTKLVERADN